MDNVLKLGSVVYSKAGRDSGSYYIVVRVLDENYVEIADGKKRLLSKPKIKKIKHLKAAGEELLNIAAKLSEGRQVFDKEIFSALRKFNDKNKAED